MWRSAMWIGLWMAVGLGSSCSSPQSSLQKDSVFSEEKGYLGIALRMTDDEEARALGYAQPLIRVDRVLEGSPAQTSGLERGDLIVALDGEPTFDDTQFQLQIMTRPPGSEVTLTVLDVDAVEKREMTVMLGLRPELEALLEQQDLGGAAPALRGVLWNNSDKEMWLREFRGRVVVVDFWATWCGPCLDAIPHLEALQEEFRVAGVVVVGVSAEDAEILSAYLTRHPVSYTMVRDPDHEAHGAWRVMALPSLFLVDQEGRIRGRFSGADSWEAVEAGVRGLLDSP